jgi:hypothetical protein
MGTQTGSGSKVMFWAGWIITALPVLVLVGSAIAKFVKPPGFADGSKTIGWPLDLANWLGAVEFICTLIYVIPRTSVLGAILLTGYLGGAIATHVRVGEQFILPLILGVLVWGGIYLRCGRLRAILPLRS